MKFFIALSYVHRKKLKAIIQEVKQLLSDNGHQYVVFVERQLTNSSNKEMMEAVLNELKKADVVLAEISTKEVGVGIEIGAAYAFGKPIFLFRRKKSESSTTMEGLSRRAPLEYSDINDLRNQFSALLQEIS
jgi:2'-deoxynucleoside 5'-phosphate N-hydrolase